MRCVSSESNKCRITFGVQSSNLISAEPVHTLDMHAHEYTDAIASYQRKQPKSF